MWPLSRFLFTGSAEISLVVRSAPSGKARSLLIAQTSPRFLTLPASLARITAIAMSSKSPRKMKTAAAAATEMTATTAMTAIMTSAYQAVGGAVGGAAQTATAPGRATSLYLGGVFGTGMSFNKAQAVEIGPRAPRRALHIGLPSHHDGIVADVGNEIWNLRPIGFDVELEEKASQHRIASIQPANPPWLSREIEGEQFIYDLAPGYEALSVEESPHWERRHYPGCLPLFRDPRIEESHERPCRGDFYSPRILDQVLAGNYVVFAVEQPFGPRLDEGLEDGSHLQARSAALTSRVRLQFPTWRDFGKVGVGCYERQAIGV